MDVDLSSSSTDIGNKKVSSSPYPITVRVPIPRSPFQLSKKSQISYLIITLINEIYASYINEIDHKLLTNNKSQYSKLNSLIEI